MTDWQIAMFSIAPLLLASGVGAVSYWRAIEPKARCWAVMLAASLATYALDPVTGAVPFMVYASIDFLACVAVSARRYYLPQRAIAGGFLAMLLLDVTAYASGHDGTGWFQTASLILGYAMWAILLLWSARDACRGLGYYLWGGGGVLPVPSHKSEAGSGGGQ